jgi:hypothetical protein
VRAQQGRHATAAGFDVIEQPVGEIAQRKSLMEPVLFLSYRRPDAASPLPRRVPPQLLLGYYTGDGKLIYAGRVGTGMPDKVLSDLCRRLDPLTRASIPLSAPPPRKNRFGSPLVLSRVHRVEPRLVAEITYLTGTDDGLLRPVRQARSAGSPRNPRTG